MLMLLRKRVLTGTVELKGLILALVYCDSLFACSAVARSCICKNREISRYYPVIYKRINYGSKSACITARNCDSVRCAYLFPVSR